MWIRHEHHGGEYTGPAAALIRPEYRGPATGERRPVTRADLLRWSHDGGADDILSFEVWRSDRTGREPRNLPPEGWFALRCLTGREFLAEEELKASGLRTWVPGYRTLCKPRHRRKPVETQRPLLPGYAMAYLLPEHWALVCGARHIIGWICDGKGPMPILKTQQMDVIAERAASGEFDGRGLGPNIKAGTMLEVLLGPMRGWRVNFLGMVGSKIEAEIDLMGAPRRVRINPSHVNLKG